MANSSNVPGETDGGKPPLSFTHSDLQHLKAAQGWVELGAWDVANDELENITPQLRAHPDVLKVRFGVYLAAKHFELATAAADGLVKMLPEDSEGWIHRSYALHEMGRTAEAQEKLRPAAEKFPTKWEICYNLACYDSQLGEMDEARALLERAFTLGDAEQVKEEFARHYGTVILPTHRAMPRHKGKVGAG
jgi:tetratricopeptide (TPR) repeat protein